MARTAASDPAERPRRAAAPGVTSSTSSRVPTAPTHTVRRAQHDGGRVGHGPGHAQHGSRAPRARGPRPGTGAQEPPRREADGAQQAHLLQPLLDAEAEEEAGQEQRRHHQEEAEVHEVLAEVGGASRGARARCCAHRRDDEAVARREPVFGPRGASARSARAEAVRVARLEAASSAQIGARRGTSRSEVTRPRRWPQSRCAASSGRKALGVVRQRSQYSSSFGRMRFRSTGNGGSQSERWSDSVMPG